MSALHPPDNSPAIQAGRPGRLSIRSDRDGNGHTIALSGELDIQGRSRLEEELTRVESTDASRIVIDLTNLDFIDSTGLGVLVGAYRRCDGSDSQELRIVPPAGDAIRTFEICGLLDVLPMDPKSG